MLDPACGSGNFLYVAINLLLDLEKEVIAYAASHGLSLIPHVRPTQLAGLEINPYAQELAQAVIWIGYLQWMHHNGFKPPNDPVLEPIETIRCTRRDPRPFRRRTPEGAGLARRRVHRWQSAVLGDKKMRERLGNDYVETLATFSRTAFPDSRTFAVTGSKGREQIARAGA